MICSPIVLIFALLSIIAAALSAAGTFKPNSDDGASWVDPTDMLRYDPMTRTMRPEKVLEDAEGFDTRHETTAIDYDAETCDVSGEHSCHNQDANRKFSESTNRRVDSISVRPLIVHTGKQVGPQPNASNPVLLFVVRHVRRLLLLFNVNDKHTEEILSLDVHMTLTADDVRVLRLFVDSKGSIQDVDRVLDGMMNVIDRDEANWVDNVTQALIREEWSEFVKKNVLYVLAGLVVLMLLRWMLWSRSGSYLWKLLFILLLSSILMEWVLLYQETEVAKRTQRSKFNGVPKECDPNSMTYWEAFVSYFSRDDRCNEYHAAMIDSQWSVTPLYAAASAIAKTMPAFGKGFGDGLSKFFTSYMRNFGFFEQYFMLPFAIIMVAIFIVYPMTAMVYAATRPRPAVQENSRAMIEDVKNVDARLKRVEAAVAAESSGSSSPPVIQQHHHNYYYADKSVEKPSSSEYEPVQPPTLDICCPNCKSQCYAVPRASLTLEEPAEVTNFISHVMTVTSTSEGES